MGGWGKKLIKWLGRLVDIGRGDKIDVRWMDEWI